MALVAISVDDVDTNRGLVAKLGLAYPVLADVSLAVTRSFGVEDRENQIAWPAIFVIARDRRIRWRWLADDYRERIPAAELLERLDALPTPQGEDGRKSPP
jgi:peroxiredoxin